MEIEISKRVEVLKSILSQTRYTIVFAILAIIIGLIFSVTSDIVITKTLQINQTIETSRIILIGLLIVAMSANFTIIIHNYENRVKREQRAAGASILVALFSSACPFCQPIWLIWLGFGSATAFLGEIGGYLGLFSLSLLLFSLYQNLNNKCQVIKNGKND